MADPIGSVLSKLALSRLNEMRTEATDQIADLQQQLAWIERAIHEKSGRPSDSPGSPPRRPRHIPHGGRPRRSPKRDAIAGVLNSRELGRVWTPSEVRDSLMELHGMDSTVEAVRITLRRMFQDGEVERGGPGDIGWKLPSDEEATQEAPPDEPRSANGYAPEGDLTLSTGQPPAPFR